MIQRELAARPERERNQRNAAIRVLSPSSISLALISKFIKISSERGEAGTGYASVAYEGEGTDHPRRAKDSKAKQEAWLACPFRERDEKRRRQKTASVLLRVGRVAATVYFSG